MSLPGEAITSHVLYKHVEPMFWIDIFIITPRKYETLKWETQDQYGYINTLIVHVVSGLSACHSVSHLFGTKLGGISKVLKLIARRS